MYYGFRICPGRQKSILQCFWQGSYETTTWEIHFWGYACVCATVYERETVRDRGELPRYFGGRQAIGFIRLSKAPYVENTLIRPPYISGLLLIHPGYLKSLSAPRGPRLVLSFPQTTTTSFGSDKPSQLHHLSHV